MGPFEKYNPLPLSVNGKKLDSNVKSNNNSMWPAVIAAVAAIAGSVINSISQSKANKKNVAMQQQTNAQNYQIFQEQQQFNKNQFYQQLEYSTPANQMQRYRDAGLNPYIAAGQVSSGTPTSFLTSASSAPMQSATVQPNTALGDSVQNSVQNIASIIQAYSQARLSDSQARLNDANAKYVDRKSEAEIGLLNNQGSFYGFQADNSKFDFDLKSATRENTIKLSDMSLSQATQYLKNSEQQYQQLVIQNESARFHLDLDKKYSDSLLQQSLYRAINENSEIKARIASINYDTDVYKPGMLANDRQRTSNDTQRTSNDTRLTTAQINKLAADTVKAYEEASGVRVDNATRGQINNALLRKYGVDTSNADAEGYVTREQVKGFRRNKAGRNLYIGSKTAGDVLEPLFKAVGAASGLFKGLK